MARSPVVSGPPDPSRMRAFRMMVSYIGTRNQKSEVGLHEIDDAVVAIDDSHLPPLVPGETRMGDVERDHVADADVRIRRHLHVGVLVHDLRQRPASWRRFGRRGTATWP